MELTEASTILHNIYGRDVISIKKNEDGSFYAKIREEVASPLGYMKSEIDHGRLTDFDLKMFQEEQDYQRQKEQSEINDALRRSSIANISFRLDKSISKLDSLNESLVSDEEIKLIKKNLTRVLNSILMNQDLKNEDLREYVLSENDPLDQFPVLTDTKFGDAIRDIQHDIINSFSN